MASLIWCLILLPGLLFGYQGSAQPNESRFSLKNTRKSYGYGRPVLAMANSPRCIFNGKPLEDGKSVSSPEPCLNCTCSKGILLCYLRTCNSVVPTPGCKIIKKQDKCCPQLDCGELPGSGEPRTERTSESSNKFKQGDNAVYSLPPGPGPRTAGASPGTRRPQAKGAILLKGTVHSQGKSDIEGGSSYYEQEEDIVEDELSPDRNNTAQYCFSRGHKYTEGMAMLTPTKCEYCYCIHGQKMCVRPKCHLSVEGCVPRYQSGYTCCPSHYNCEIAAGASAIVADEDEPHSDSVKGSQFVNKVTSCNVEGYDFDVGVAVPSNGHCQTCYCTQVGVVCRRLECSPSVPGCTPVIPEGHCCPTQYKCDQKNANGSHAPVSSHSTDNYDVTVMSPSDPEPTSQTSRTDVPETTHAEDIRGKNPIPPKDGTESDSSSEKQKITVDLPNESDLESISVIPEENIAVLVLTTEKEANEEDADPSSETIDDGKTSDPIAFSSKRKTATTKPPNIIKGATKPSTLGAVTRPITISGKGERTTPDPSSWEDDEANNYAYDYEESYDDAEPDTKETFNPFSDYASSNKDETTSTRKSLENTPPSIIKKGEINTYRNRPTVTVKLPTTTLNEHTDSETTETEYLSDASRYATSHSTKTGSQSVKKVTADPFHAFYISDRTRHPASTPSVSVITKQNAIHKTKVRHPGLVTKPQFSVIRTQSTRPSYMTSPSKLTIEEFLNLHTIPYDTTSERRTHPPHTSSTNTRPEVRPTLPSKKKTPTIKRRPEIPSLKQGATTRPVPQDIADFVMTLTQMHNTQTPTSSYEIFDPPTRKGTGEVSVAPDTMSSLALAAPKRILEEQSQNKETATTMQTESANEVTDSATAVLNFAPEIIFSNHGPSYNNRLKQPPSSVHFVPRETEIPMVINNHKRTSTRMRPPMRVRPSPSTPSLEDGFVEISNHRPTHTFRRPPNKFPPFPHVNRPDGNFFRDTHTKLHRIEPDAPGEWPDSYDDDYYYDDSDDKRTDPDDKMTTKVFHNIRKHPPTHPDTSSTESSLDYTASTKMTSSHDVVGTQKDTSPNLPEKTSEMGVKEGDFSASSTPHSTRSDPPDTSTEVDIRTSAPHSATTKSEPFDTTLSFSGYVRNKYKGISSHVHENEPKFFRGDDENKGRGTDFRLIDFGKKPEENFPDVPPQKVYTSSTEAPTQPPSQQGDDPEEISDVCFVDGMYYTSGQTIKKSNPCEMCRCFYGHPLCQIQQCPPPPDPSCFLDYRPGYCCPEITCGIEFGSDHPTEILSVPDPTSPEIRPEETDNQWKPLPNGPVIRKSERGNNEPDRPIIEIVTAPLPDAGFVAKHEEDAKTEESNAERELVQFFTQTTPTERPRTSPLAEEVTSTFRPETPTAKTAEEVSTTEAYPFFTLQVDYNTKEDADPHPIQQTAATPTTIVTHSTPLTDDDVTVPYDTTAMSKDVDIEGLSGTDDENARNKSGIHDNSSGVRKLDEVITLPSSKVELSGSNGTDFSTVLPVFVTLQTNDSSSEESETETVTVDPFEFGTVVTEPGGNLKVSGCNVYGKYYRINDKVTALTRSCGDCVCTVDGITCSSTC